MIRRHYGFLEVLDAPVPEAAAQLEADGFAVLEQVFDGDAVAELAREIDAVFDAEPIDDRPARLKTPEHDQHRYAMLNRSAACQRAIAHPRILETIEPLLGADCHVIANTAWRNPSGVDGSDESDIWHIDAGPHVPRPEGTAWPDEIPYPVFAIGCHILLIDSRLEDGPTAVIPGSHRSGQHPPFDHLKDAALEWQGEACRPLLGRSGDVVLFVSDVWHRRMPTQAGEHGRFFLQAHYGRRDLAQRLCTTAEVNQVSDEATARAASKRDRTLIGLHAPGFYDG